MPTQQKVMTKVWKEMRTFKRRICSASQAIHTYINNSINNKPWGIFVSDVAANACGSVQPSSHFTVLSMFCETRDEMVML